ncbi:MAG: hypothetical protein WD431_24140 [Cyclobacteriaceae bacterium]
MNFLQGSNNLPMVGIKHKLKQGKGEKQRYIMNLHADKSSENKSQAHVNGPTKPQTNVKSIFQFVDNRPEAISQRKLQEMANNSHQAKKVAQFQATADHAVSTIQFGRDKGDKGVGNSGKKRQGKKGQRDKKHGLMLDNIHGKGFTDWLHKRKQREGRRNDFTAQEIKGLEQLYLKEIGAYQETEIPPQPFSPIFPPDDDDSGGEGIYV